MKTDKTSCIILVMLLLITSIMSFAQEKATGKSCEPDVKIDVKKEYDEQGNIIRYDSTYSYSWFNGSPFIDGSEANIDSLLQQFGFFEPFRFNADSIFENLHMNWSTIDDSVHMNSPNDFLGNHRDFFDEFDWFSNKSFPNFAPDNFDKEIKEMLEQQKQMMEEFRQNFQLNQPFYFQLPDDSSKKEENDMPPPQKQNNPVPKKGNKTITI